MENYLILIAEDEPEIAEIIETYLIREGYRTVCAADGETAFRHCRQLKPDLVILDIGLPKRDGLELLSEIRRNDQTPVIMATARSEDIDKIVALRTGADDYIVKPFVPQEIVERVKAVLRRTHGQVGHSTPLRCCGLEIDPSSYTVSVKTKDGITNIDATLSEYNLLKHMIASLRRAFSRGELLDACFPDSDALDRTIDSHVSHLRKKLQQAGLDGYLEAIRGVGYRLEPIR